MNIEGLLYALCYIAIICIVFGIVMRIAPLPPPVPPILWGVCAILCILILMDAIGGGGHLYYGHRLH